MTRVKAFPLLEGGLFRFGLIAALGVLVALATELHLSANTVKTHIRIISSKPRRSLKKPR